MSEKNSNPLQDPIVIIVLLAAVSGGVGKCAFDAKNSIETVATGFFGAVGHILGYYLLPFVIGSAAVMMGLALICRFGRDGKVHAVDFSHIGVGISFFSALALLIVGIPGGKNEAAYAIWAAILFGGPLLLWFFGSVSTMTEDEQFEKSLVEPRDKEIRTLEIKLGNSEWSCGELKHQLVAVKKEIETLKSQKPLAEEKRKGILDSDDF
jgi:hypothetical protein